jgi:phosphate:Na+ symporter
LPVLLVASLMAALTHGQTERFGRGLAGLCLLFIGLDMMQAGAAVFDGVLTPDQLPGDTHWGRLQLVALGAAVVAVLQSSSAGVVMVLVLAGSGALSFGQGAALVIGMNIGTTTTGLLAGVGAGRAARQTGIANFMFNAVTAAIAFPLVGVVAPLLHGTALGRDDATALVLFHTGFNLLGAALFLPVTPLFARLVDRLVADRPQGLAAGLDRALLDTPDSALDAGHTACAAISDALFAAVGAALAPEPDLRGLSTLPDRIPPALTAVDSFLAGVRIPADRAETKARYAALLHQIDHLSRLDDRARNRDALAILPDDPGLRRAAHALGAALRHPDPVRLERLVRLLEMREHRHRRATLLREHVGLVSVAEVFRRTDAMRWLLHLAQHAERISHYRAIGAAAPAPARKN